MSRFRQTLREVSANTTYQVSDLLIYSRFFPAGQISDTGPRNDQWSPENITGLKVWLDADNISWVTQSSGAITNWTNRVGSVGGDFQPAGNLTPTLVDMVFGVSTRAAVMYSTGTVDSGWMASSFNFESFVPVSAPDAWNYGSAGDFSWWFVVQANPDHRDGAATYAYNLPAITTEEGDGYMLVGGRGAGGGATSKFRFDATKPDWDEWVVSSDNIVSGTNYIINVLHQRKSPGVSSTGYYLTMSVNGGTDVVLDQGSEVDPFSVWHVGSQKMRLGGSVFPKSAQSRNRYFYEVLLFSGKVDNVDRDQITNYLRNKWDIGL